MLGIKHYQRLNSGYIEELVSEYGIIHKSQAYAALKKSGCKKAERHWHINNGLRNKKYFEFGEYFVPQPQFDGITPGQLRTVKSIWVLLEYIDVADRHYALHEFSSIGFERGSVQVEIAVVGAGEEGSAAIFLNKARAEMIKKMSYALLQKYIGDKEAQDIENTKYIIIVEEEGQIENITVEQVLSFALVSETGGTSFYALEQAENE